MKRLALIALSSSVLLSGCAITPEQQSRLWDRGLDIADRVIDRKIPKTPTK